MKLAVSYDEQGDILVLFDPEKLQGNKVTLKYAPAKGEKHVVLEVPKELEGRPFLDLPTLLRVNASGSQPRLELKA
jgi:hypothetical protein